jgi:hypothetical protein
MFNVDTTFSFPVPNRIFEITNQNINNTDVYVQETDEQGNVLAQWTQVPELAGQNIIYNSIQYGERNIFDVLTNTGDTVSIRFPDGNFGNVPTGLFRFWTRVSANQYLTIRPENAQGLKVTIPYIGADGQLYNLTVTYSLEYTVSNSAPTETNEQIKQRAPAIYSTQDRMVNGSDYNVLPLIYGNQIVKLQAINRTYSGQSRYIDITDPTGFHRDLLIFGQDGALYRDNEDLLTTVTDDGSTPGRVTTIVLDQIQTQLRDKNLQTFYYDEYLRQFEDKVRVANVVGTTSLLELTNTLYSHPVYWHTSPNKSRNTTGYFVNPANGGFNDAVLLVNDANFQPYSFIKTGSTLIFADSPEAAPVTNVIQYGEPLDPAVTTTGPVELGVEIQNQSQGLKVYPVFRTELNAVELIAISAAIDNGSSFWMYYDLIADVWGVSDISGSSTALDQPFDYPAPNSGIYSDWIDAPLSWLVYVEIVNTNQSSVVTYNITTRGRTFVFDSYRDVRFFWEPNQIIIDSSTGLALQDTIEIMPLVNTNDTIDNNDPHIVNPATSFLRVPVYFNISGTFIQDDGYQDPSKVEVSLVDNNSDGIPDDPSGIDRIMSLEDRIVFEYYSNELTGYQSTRPWISMWDRSLENITTFLYVHIPSDPSDPTKADIPFISDNSDPNLGTKVYMSDVDLLFVNNSTLINGIADQLTAFFNESVAGYTWLSNTTVMIDKRAILTAYFTDKVYTPIKNSTGNVYVPGYGVYEGLTLTNTNNINVYPTGLIVTPYIDTTHYDKNGKVFTQNTSVDKIERLPFYFKWSHYSPVDQRIDPAPSNIIDMIVLTDTYYQDVLTWKNKGGSINTMPVAPTTEELRSDFNNLNDYKMVSDAIVWNSGKFKLLFGSQAAPELQANFLVVKSPTNSVSDNEIKTRVIQAVDTYFDIRNWDFGETFFYTELAAFIHQQLSSIISSVVIVPKNANSQFGNLFEIISSPAELFLSTATVNNVQIVSNFTEANLRI